MTPAEVIDKWGRMSRMAATVTAALSSTDGRVVDQGDLIEMVRNMVGGSDAPSMGAITTAIKWARKAGVPIETFRAVGWRLNNTRETQ